MANIMVPGLVPSDNLVLRINHLTGVDSASVGEKINFNDNNLLALSKTILQSYSHNGFVLCTNRTRDFVVPTGFAKLFHFVWCYSLQETGHRLIHLLLLSGIPRAVIQPNNLSIAWSTIKLWLKRL